MTYSMTGFARKELAAAWGTLAIEIKSVNHRYLENYFRLPDTFRPAEIPLRELIRRRLKRGKVECQVRFVPSAQHKDQLVVNQDLVRSLTHAVSEVSAIAINSALIDPLAILQYPGVLEEQALDTDLIESELMKLADAALTDLLAHRQREGQEMAAAIEERLAGISDVVADVRELMPLIIDRQRKQLQEKIADLQVELDPQRVEQEIILLAQKADVAEELDRLDTHVQEARHVLKQKGAIGRRLDFLMQEFNREANTLSSKSIVTETTKRAVDLKVFIEQMREQVQNIE